MKRDSTITFNYFSFIVLFFIVCNLTSNSSQAFEIKNKTYNKKQALTNEDISTKLTLADKHRISDPTLFKELLFELREQANITTEQQYYLDLLYSYHLTFIGKYKIAESKLNNIIYSNANNLIKFRANYALIYISMPKRDWLGGLKYLTKNISLLPTIDNNEHYQNGLVTTIIFYNKIRQYKLALSYINKLKNQPLTKINSCLLKQLSLETKFNLNKLISDDGLIDDAIETCEQVKFDIATNIIIILKAKLYLNDKTPDKALSTLLPFIVNTNNTHYPMLIAEMNNVIAKAYWQINDIDNAQVYATKALTINKGMTNILQGVETYFLLYQIAKKQQDLSLALRYFEQYSEIEKRHLEGEKAKHLAFQLAEHNSFAQESQIKLLNEQNNALAAEQALAKTQAANRKLVILLLGVVILAFTFIGIRFSRSHKRVKELAEYDPLTGIY
ncbi:MAG TPA: GGDEF domain-containing protein, partial [Colwellia sp.]|nr:GGDEF domain-containing protein [Colwellia sp.]